MASVLWRRQAERELLVLKGGLPLPKPSMERHSEAEVGWGGPGLEAAPGGPDGPLSTMGRTFRAAVPRASST